MKAALLSMDLEHLDIGFSHERCCALLVLFVLSGCSTAMFDDDAFAKDLPQQVDTSSSLPRGGGEIRRQCSKVGEIAKDAHGVVNVHRHGQVTIFW